MTLPPDILLRSSEEAARRLALELLDQARAAVNRLDDPADQEALHDFRVAIRRTRATLRAWWPHLKGGPSRKHLRWLRTLQQDTGAGRDAEVALAWITPLRGSFRPNQRVGFDWLLEQLRARCDGAYAQVRTDVRRRFDKIEPRLREALGRFEITVNLIDPKPPKRAADALATAARAHGADLKKRLERAGESGDPAVVHRARIACKRLRYLVEPIAPLMPEAAQIVAACKTLQDVLGDLNDSALLAEELRSAVARAATERAQRLHGMTIQGPDEQRMRRETARSEEPGLLELARRVQERMDGLVEILRRDWVSGGAAALTARVGALADSLLTLRGEDVEIERKYLLDGLPACAREATCLEIDQGWLPGRRLRERIRRARWDGGEDYHRTVKLGRGIERFELDEETTANVFEALWPLTLGCRVHKRRYLIPEGDLVWEIDEFTDRELFLAEVELPSATTVPQVPEWLVPHVVREVTDDPAYVNLNLAG